LLGRKFGDLADVTLARIGETDAKVAAVGERVADVEQKLARAAYGGGAPARAETWGAAFTREREGELRDLARANKGAVALAVKSAVTTGAASAGAFEAPHQGDPALMPRRAPTIRSLLPVVEATSGTIEFAAQTARATAAATVAEGAPKPESDMSFALRTVRSQVVAHWLKASRQALEDLTQLRDLIDAELRSGLALAEEAQLLNGDGTGSNLTGLIPAAAAFADPLALSSPNQIDAIGSAILQAALAEHQPDGIVLHPADWARMRMTKDADGRYLLGDPGAAVEPRLFGLPVVATTAMPVDTFLVGAFAQAATIYDRMAPQVEVAYAGDDFTRNLVTILAEQRLALAIRQPGALVYGDFGLAP
jgi:HK97 family phage major capsid protein